MAAQIRAGGQGRRLKRLHSHLQESVLLRRLQTAAEEAQPDERVTSDWEARPIEPGVLESVARRNLPMMTISSYITGGIEQALQNTAKNSKAVRKSAFALTDRLKQRSRSRARGGDNDSGDILEATTKLKAMPRKAPDWKATAQQIKRMGTMELSEASAHDVQQQWQPDGAAPLEPSLEKIEYTTEETAGYAAARLPACYSVVWRVLDEVELRLPDFQPTSMLDFGAGPGTAVWAASEIFEESLATVHAVEPSDAMRHLGIQIERQWRSEAAAEASAEAVHDSVNLEASRRSSDPPGAERDELGDRESAIDAPSASSARPGSGTLREDKNASAEQGRGIGDRLALPGSSFGRQWSIRWLAHLHGFQDRRQLAAKGAALKSGSRRARQKSPWVQSTGGRAYDLVVASYCLGELEGAGEQRKALKALWHATADVLVLVEPGTPTGSALVRSARAQILEWEEALGSPRKAHVVAPCPHDGHCPMDGTTSWCHFSQRFERPRMQRLAKIRHAQPLPRSHQDERFSYVVLRRTPRPPTAGEVTTQEHLDLREAWRQLERSAPAARDVVPRSGSKEEVLSPEVEELIRASMEAEEEEDDSESEIEHGGEEFEREEPDLEELCSQGTVQDGRMDARLGEAAVGESTPAEEQCGSVASERPSPVWVEGSQLDMAAAASQQWSRIVRPPRKRHGHIVVDLCARSGPDADPFASGSLVQQALGNSQKKRALGAVGHRIAKRLTWGDLWPDAFTKAQ